MSLSEQVAGTKIQHAEGISSRNASVSASASAPGLAIDEDAAVLAKMGYKQELRRNFTMIEVFGIAFSIMGLLPSIASTLAYSIPAGPVGMVWGWFVPSKLPDELERSRDKRCSSESFLPADDRS
ncbi:MAG: hypothetical protein Q9160_000499 [Pyrenula sp. 1 TL-2023]